MGEMTRNEASEILLRHRIPHMTVYGSADLINVCGTVVARRLAALEGALGSLSRQVEARIADGALWLPDHACAECVPGSDLLVAGFRCGRHAALAALDEQEVW